MEQTNIARAEQAYDAYAAQLYRVAYSLLQSRECAEDAVQDAFARYLAHDGRFRDSEHEKVGSSGSPSTVAAICSDPVRFGLIPRWTRCCSTPTGAARIIWKASRCCRQCCLCPKSTGRCWCSMDWKASRWTRWQTPSV